MPVTSTARNNLLWTTCIFCGAFALYWGWTYILPYTPRPSVAYFDLLADAWLEGRLDLPQPTSIHDLTQYEGRWYVPFPPLPAILLLPYVAFKGVLDINVVWFSCVIGALTVVAMYQAFREMQAKGLTRLNHAGVIWLTVLFGVGTVFWVMTVQGSVWNFAQVSAVLFVAIAVWLTVRTESLWWGGLALAFAVLARPLIVLTAPLLIALYIEVRPALKGNYAIKDWWRPLLQLVAAPTVAVFLLLLHNELRFASPLDFGYLTQNIAGDLKSDFDTYGQFSMYFLQRNLKAMLWGVPLLQNGRLLPDPQGMSIFVTTPALIYLAHSLKVEQLAGLIWGTIGLLIVPLLLYYNTGWYQFGYRFSLDFIVPMFVLLAVYAPLKLPWHYKTLISVSVLVNAAGVLWIGLPTQ